MNIDHMIVEAKGTTPLIMNNGQMANPLNPLVKKLKSLTSKRNKTEDDLLEILELQWEGALYYSDDVGGLYIPSEMIFSSLSKAAKKHKMGPKISGITVDDPIGFPLITDHHESIVELRKDEKNRFDKMVVIMKARTLKRRAIFHNWKVKFDLEFERDIIDPNEIKTLLQTQSCRVGFGDWAPGHSKPGVYGKFIIENLTHVDSKGNKTVLKEKSL